MLGCRMETGEKGYYVYYVSEDGLSGIEKKVDNQIQEFNRYFDVEGIGIKKEETNLIRSCIWRLPFGSYGRKYEEAFAIIRNPIFIYIRCVPVDRRFFIFIKKMRRKFPKALFLLEIPTFPYKRELLCDAQMWPFYIKDNIYHGFLKRYIDKVVTFSDDKVIWGIPTIPIMNGIMVDSVKPICRTRSKSDNIIRLLAVATLQKSHGYERLIRGLAEYYQQEYDRIIEIHIVGEGPEWNYYKKIVSQFHLERYVIFYGKKTGKELDAIYDNMDIALGAFGFYKRKILKSSSLKMREYLAKGLPVITGCHEDVFDKAPGCPYYLQMPDNDTTVDMQEVLFFYDRIYQNGVTRKKIINNIREIAKNEVDIEVTMKPVVDYIMKGK